MKSIVSLLAMAPDRAQAATWASELEKNGFQHHSVEEIKKSLQVNDAPSVGWSFLTSDRILQHHHLLFPTKTLSELQVATPFLATDMVLDTHHMMAPRVTKGKTGLSYGDH
jgi:hypothetical protein